MSLLLTVTDNADGTGGIVSLSGAAPADVTAVQYAVFSGDARAYPLTAAGTINGNGALAVNPGSAIYQWVATGPSGAALTFQALTDAAAASSIHFAILEAVRNRIAALNLPGLTTATILRRWVPRVYEKVEASITPPFVIVAPIGGEEYDAPGLADVLSLDNIGWPVVVVIVDKPAGDALAVQNRDLWYRERIQRCLRNQRLPGVPRNIKAAIVPDAIVDVGAFLKGYIVSITVFHFFTREDRGL